MAKIIQIPLFSFCELGNNGWPASDKIIGLTLRWVLCPLLAACLSSQLNGLMTNNIDHGLDNDRMARPISGNIGSMKRAV